MKQYLPLVAALSFLGCGSEPSDSASLGPHLVFNFDAGSVAPAVEELRCVDVASDAERSFVSRFDIEKAGLHHVNVWLRPPGTAARGDVYECPATEDGAFLFDDSFAAPVHWDLPGVIELPAGSVFTARCHVLNASAESLGATMHVVAGLSEERAPLLYGVALSHPILPDVPPASEITVSFRAPPASVRLYTLFGHQHAHGTLETASVDGAEVYRNIDWAEPIVRSEIIELEASDVFDWSCTVRNDATWPISWGQNSVQRSEMCVLFGLGSKSWDTHGQVLP